jgi:hypothetical protein
MNTAIKFPLNMWNFIAENFQPQKRGVRIQTKSKRSGFANINQIKTLGVYEYNYTNIQYRMCSENFHNVNSDIEQ